MIAAVVAEDWTTASSEIASSTYCTQVPCRCQQNRICMDNCFRYTCWLRAVLRNGHVDDFACTTCDDGRLIIVAGRRRNRRRSVRGHDGRGAGGARKQRRRRRERRRLRRLSCNSINETYSRSKTLQNNNNIAHYCFFLPHGRTNCAPSTASSARATASAWGRAARRRADRARACRRATSRRRPTTGRSMAALAHQRSSSPSASPNCATRSSSSSAAAAAS